MRSLGLQLLAKGAHFGGFDRVDPEEFGEDLVYFYNFFNGIAFVSLCHTDHQRAEGHIGVRLGQRGPDRGGLVKAGENTVDKFHFTPRSPSR